MIKIQFYTVALLALLLTHCDTAEQSEKTRENSETKPELHTNDVKTTREIAKIERKNREKEIQLENKAENIISGAVSYAELLEADEESKDNQFADLTFEQAREILESNSHLDNDYIKQRMRECSDYKVAYYFGTSLFHRILSGEITVKYDIEKMKESMLKRNKPTEFIDDYIKNITDNPNEAACYSVLRLFDLCAFNGDYKGVLNLENITLNASNSDITKSTIYNNLTHAYNKFDDDKRLYITLESAFPYELKMYKKYKMNDDFEYHIFRYLVKTSNRQEHEKVKNILETIEKAGYDTTEFKHMTGR